MNGMEAMTAQDGRTWCEDIKNLMATWDKCRATWIERFGNDIGFDKWFSMKLERGQ